MSEKKRITITLVGIVAVVILVLLCVFTFITKNFVVDAILHIYLRLLSIPIVIKVLQKCFNDMLSDSMNKVLVLCGSIFLLDFVVVDAFRFVLCKGISTILFLPACVPICFMIIPFYSSKDTERDKKEERRLMYLVGIPLLLLSLYSEILSFI